MKEVSETQQKILDVAKVEFLKHGFERASLREIVKKAGFTQGAFYGYYDSKAALFEALVEPTITAFMEGYKQSEKKHFDSISAEQIVPKSEMSSQGRAIIIEYVYQHLDEFRLILCSSSGTKYENFMHDFATLNAEASIRYYDKLRELGKIEGSIEPELVHILISAYHESFFEVVRHDIKKEDAIIYIEKIAAFFSAGFRDLVKYI